VTQAILLEDVEALGQRGDPIDVSPGYLRNYLIPRKLAAKATPGALEEAQRRRVAAEKAEKARTEREAEAASLLSKSGPARTASSSARSAPRRSPTPCARPATCESTGAKSASSSRSGRSARTWSRSSSPMAASPP
jgi:hypothetical protein